MPLSDDHQEVWLSRAQVNLSTAITNAYLLHDRTEAVDTLKFLLTLSEAELGRAHGRVYLWDTWEKYPEVLEWALEVGPISDVLRFALQEVPSHYSYCISEEDTGRREKLLAIYEKNPSWIKGWFEYTPLIELKFKWTRIKSALVRTDEVVSTSAMLNVLQSYSALAEYMGTQDYSETDTLNRADLEHAVLGLVGHTDPFPVIQWLAAHGMQDTLDKVLPLVNTQQSIFGLRALADYLEAKAPPTPGDSLWKHLIATGH